ncbi:MAG: class I SAM-dependent methyltransferase [Bacteroidota bacterium]|nr:class I SAM-dependent methyltransferase [Bacteroidota bacterium]
MLQKAFNNYAEQYDGHFTNSLIGKAQRKQVYSYLNILNYFANKSILEINCGTGEDAKVFSSYNANVTATDISKQMIACAKQKNENSSIHFIECAIQDIEKKFNSNTFDVVFSNFGGLNCLNEKELIQFFKAVTHLTLPKSDLVFVIMGTNCFVEKLYFFLKFNRAKVLRRKQKLGVETNINGEIFTTFYYSPKELKNIFKSGFEIVNTKPIGLFVPPSYIEPFVRKHPNFLKLFVKLDSFFTRFSFLSNISDHYLIHLKRI